MKSVKLYKPQRQIIARPRESRKSRHERGYDSVWERRSSRFRSKSPVCVECYREGRVTPVDVVDHKIPVTDRPDLRLDSRNWWSLCNFCHNGIKRRMETYARQHNMVEKLTLWCDEPETRPKALRETKTRKVKETMVV